MKCKNTSGKCNYQDRLKPAEGQGSFQGFDVFQCPKCKEVATTVKKSVIKKESCPSCGIEATEGNEVAGFKCPNCDQQPRHHPSNFAHEDLGDNTGLPSRINKFVSKSGEKIFGDMGEQKPFMVEGEPDKINYYGRKTKLDKSIKKAIDTPLYSIKKDNPDPDAAYDEMRERRPIRKPKIEPDLDAMKDDVDVEKWRPSKGAGAAIGGGTGAIIAGPLGAAGGAYLGHKLGKDKVKKAVPGWESTPQNTCPTCGQAMPNNGMECAAHSNVIGLASRINNFVDKGRDFQTKGERREQNKRPRMPMSGRNTGEVYRNAVEKRAPKPSKKMGNINKAGAPILPCKSCGKQVPHFKSSPPTTQGLCSECVRTSLTKPNTVKKALWNTQKVCTDPKCGWKQPYDKNDKRHSVLHQATACPQCKKPVNTEGFSPDF